MMTLRQLATEPPMLPTRMTWYLTDLAEARGKQELFTRQSPQKLKVLREHALIESAISSNRIEGVEVDKSRVGTLIFGKPALRDRDEEEVRVWISSASTRSAMATVAPPACCSCSLAITAGSKPAATSVLNGSWSRTRSVTTKSSNKVRSAGTKANTIRGRR